MWRSLTERIRNLKDISFTRQILVFSPSSCRVGGEKSKQNQADAELCNDYRQCVQSVIHSERGEVN